MKGLATLLTSGLVLPSPVPPQEVQVVTHRPVDVATSSVLLEDGISFWLASASPAPPSKADIQLLRQAFAEFYGVNRDLTKSEALLSQVVRAWEGQPADERAGLYRVRGDCYSSMGDAAKAYEDYDMAVQLLSTEEAQERADPTELPASLLGRARSRKSMASSLTEAQARQAARDYEQYLKLTSREDWDTDQELLEDGALRNPYAAWEWGSVLRRANEWKKASEAHLLASQAFVEIGDRARSVISLIDAGIDLAAVGEVKNAQAILEPAIQKTKGVEARDVQLLQRVVAKEGEGRMALASLLWTSGEKAQAEQVLGDACVRLEQLQADAASRKPVSATNAFNTLKFSIDDITALEVSCYRFKNPVFLEQLGWPASLQEKVIKLETLR